VASFCGGTQVAISGNIFPLASFGHKVQVGNKWSCKYQIDANDVHFFSFSWKTISENCPIDSSHFWSTAATNSRQLEGGNFESNFPHSKTQNHRVNRSDQQRCQADFKTNFNRWEVVRTVINCLNTTGRLNEMVLDGPVFDFLQKI